MIRKELVDALLPLNHGDREGAAGRAPRPRAPHHRRASSLFMLVIAFVFFYKIFTVKLSLLLTMTVYVLRCFIYLKES